jgi:hypothetical protein
MLLRVLLPIVMIPKLNQESLTWQKINLDISSQLPLLGLAQ